MTSNARSSWMCGVGALVAGLVGGLPRPVYACGGTFCDGAVPGPMPVDQTGENVIFVVGGAESEVHIQISYDPNTNAENFGWLVPLAEVPKFSVGSQPLFDQVRAATVPLYDLSTSFEDCGFMNASGVSASGGGGPTEGGEGDSDRSPSTTDGTEGGPTVLLQEAVGAFDVAVLTDTEVGPIRDWLESNGYLWDAKAEPILMQYLAEGNVIAALKLRRTTGPADIHPITLTYPSNETCFPLRLTRIAAVEDMEIRVFVLADERAAPTNYKHVLVNPLKIDWLTRAANYKQVISKAVDAFGADGRAFVTEYAGPSSTVARAPIHDPSWDDTGFLGLDPTQVVGTLNAQGLGACFDSFDCTWRHPLIFGLLLEHLPPPDGVEPVEFYAYLSQYEAMIDVALWADGAGFAAGLRDRVIDPGLHADELLTTWPYVTRLYTTISPNEMMEDPIFHINPDLAEVPALRTADNLLLCNGDSVITLPDERQFYLPNGGPWKQIPGEEWYAEEVQEVAIKGSPMTIVDNTAAIDMKLAQWNTDHDWPRALNEPDDSTALDDDEGCGCRGEPETPALGLLALALLALRRRRT